MPIDGSGGRSKTRNGRREGLSHHQGKGPAGGWLLKPADDCKGGGFSQAAPLETVSTFGGKAVSDQKKCKFYSETDSLPRSSAASVAPSR